MKHSQKGFCIAASAVFGVAAGLGISGLIAANFPMLTLEEREKQEAAVAHREAAAHSAG